MTFLENVLISNSQVKYICKWLYHFVNCYYNNQIYCNNFIFYYSTNEFDWSSEIVVLCFQVWIVICKFHINIR